MAALLAGQSISETAKQYDLDMSVVSRWASSSQLQAVASKKESDIGELVANYLRELLVTLSVQAEHCRSKPWLEKQPADQLAVNHGVLADKAFRILGAAERAAANLPEREPDIRIEA